MSNSISKGFIEECGAEFRADRANRVAMDAVMTNGLNKSCLNHDARRRTTHTFSISLEQGSVTNQKASGRCWLFAAMNVMRARVMKKCDLKDFELSQNYMLFWDKLEKCNYFLENILDTLDEPVGSRLLEFLLRDPVGDGGQWDMMANLVDKYGVVPKEAMPESAVSSSTREMCRTVTELLRGDAVILRRMAAEGADRSALTAQKERMMKELYRVLAICLGEPPKTVDFEARDRDGGFIRDMGLTPREFFKKYVDMDLSDYVSLINAPTGDKPYMRRYTVKMLGNVREGSPVCYLNLPINQVKAAAIAQLRDGEPVWFGCDVGPYSDRETGTLDTDNYDYENTLNVRLGMTKAERLDYGQSRMTHAMVFQGVNLDGEGRPTRWRVENSWGDEPGRKGYYVMSDAWFDEYMYQVVVNKKYLTPEQLAILDTPAIELEPWDPMGSLA